MKSDFKYEKEIQEYCSDDVIKTKSHKKTSILEKIAKKGGYIWFFVACFPITNILWLLGGFERFGLIYFIPLLFQMFGLFILIKYRKIIFKY